MKQPGRAGRYLRQPQGYSAFIPASLPPDPRVVMDDEMLALISQGDRALGRLDGSIQTLPDPRPLRVHVRAQGSSAVQLDRGHAKFAQRRA